MPERAECSEAVAFFALSSQQRVAKVHVNLTYCSGTDLGINRDVLRSAKWLKTAVNKGYRAGQFDNGVCCYRGDAVAVDLSMTAESFTLPANRNNCSALWPYARCPAEDHGSAKKVADSVLYWYRSRASRGTV
jgi:TPR repeat protein